MNEIDTAATTTTTQRVDTQTEKTADVVLVCMPFAPLLVPSMGLSLLKAELPTVRTKVLYFTLSFAARIGIEDYLAIAEDFNSRHLLSGDWLFSSALYEPTPERDEEYLKNVVCGPDVIAPVAEGMTETILRTRAAVPGFLDSCVEEVLQHRPRIVGFSSVFQQHVASLALAARIRQASPDTYIVFGGANCADVMGLELMRQFSWVDAMVSGQGDIIFPRLVDNIMEGRSIAGLQGVLTRQTRENPIALDEPIHAPVVEDLDSLPFPDYDDFFEQWGKIGLDPCYRPELVFETSRGCWWAQIKKCTFCGFNHRLTAFRSKSGDRARHELRHLVKKYPASRAAAVDAVLDMRYFNDFLPELAKDGLNVRLFYHVRPDLKREHLRVLSEAGVLGIQPGLESLSTQVLKLMQKGVTGLQNIQLLKWCREYDVRASWLFLWGIPGEPPEEYQRMADLVPLLTHLDPPSLGKIIRIDRFSPYFENSENYGFADIFPFHAYEHIYQIPKNALRNLAYYFDFEYRNPQEVEEYTRPLAAEIENWKAAHETSNLVYTQSDNALLIWDFRPTATDRLTTLTGVQRALYLECNGIRSLSQLQASVERMTDRPASREGFVNHLRPLLDRGLMIQEDDSFLSLAIPASAATKGAGSTP